jgi:uncharacterized membrane protein required for colicin V production
MDLPTTIISILLVIFIIRGAIRGFSGELAPLIGIIAFIGSLWYGYSPLQRLVQQNFPSLDAGTLVFYSAILTTIGATLSFWILTLNFKRIFKTILPQPFNAILGALIGVVKVVTIASVVGGLITIAQERFATLREQSEQNPFTAIVAQFWVQRFQAIDFSALAVPTDATSATPSQPPATIPNK